MVRETESGGLRETGRQRQWDDETHRPFTPITICRPCAGRWRQKGGPALALPLKSIRSSGEGRDRFTVTQRGLNGGHWGPMWPAEEPFILQAKREMERNVDGV